MLRLASFAILSLMTGCAAPPLVEDLRAPGSGAFEPAVPATLRTTETGTATSRASLFPAIHDPTYEGAPAPLAASSTAPFLGKPNSYLILRGGYWTPDTTWGDGTTWNLTYGRYFTRLLALELEGGYFDATSGGLDISGIPLMVNGRISIPVWLFELYGGLGIGGYYYDIKVAGDDWVLGGNTFLGANVALLDRLVLGLEGKYYTSENIAGSASLDALAIFLNLGLRL